MAANIGDMEAPPTQTKSWCVQWLGSEGDFLAGAKRQPIPLERLNGLENLYAIGSLDQRPGEVSIFDSVPFISEVWHSAETIDSNSIYRAEFLIYAIVECWHRNSIWQTVEGEKELAAALLPRAVAEGINVDEPFPFLLSGYSARAAVGLFCASSHQHGRTQRKSDLALFHRKGVHRNCRILFEQSTRDFDTARFSFSYASTHYG